MRGMPYDQLGEATDSANVKIVKTKYLSDGETLLMAETLDGRGRSLFYSIWREDANHIMLGGRSLLRIALSLK